MRWFRLYTDMIYDRKIRRLTPAQRWLWIAVLSMASTSPKPGYLLLSDVGECNGDVTLQDRYSNVAVTVNDLADVAAIPVSDVESGMDTFIKQQMIHIENGVYVVTNWSKRQFASDTSADRVRKLRQRRCNGDVTLQDRYSNGDVTPSDTDTELKINVRVRATEYTQDFLEFWEVYPRKVDKGAAFKQWKARIKEGTSPTDLILAARNYAETCKQLNTEERYIKHAKTFLGVSRSFEEYLTPSITEPPKQYIDPDLEEEMRFRAQVVSGTYEPH